MRGWRCIFPTVVTTGAHHKHATTIAHRIGWLQLIANAHELHGCSLAKNCATALASHSKSALDFEHSILSFKFAKSRGWIARCWRSQTTGSAMGTCNPTVNGVNGNAKIFRRLARGQTFNKNKIDGGLMKLEGVSTHSDQAVIPSDTLLLARSNSPILSVHQIWGGPISQICPPVLRANRKVAALRSARNTLF